MSAVVQFINYQLRNLLFSLELKKSYYRNWQSFHSRTMNLCFRLSHYEHLHLLECQHPILLVSMRISCIYFLSWVEGSLVLGCWPSFYVALWIFHISHSFQGSAKQTLFFYVGCLQGFWLKDFCSNPLLLLKVSWVDVSSEIYDGWLRTARN